MSIQLHDKCFLPFLSAQKIDLAVQKMAVNIAENNKNEVPVFIGVLNGAFMFVSDFLKKYPFSCEVSFVKLASYQGTKTSEEVTELIGLNQNLENRTAIILEDIVDTGNTITTLKKIVAQQNPKSIQIACLFFKPDVYKKDIKIDYIGIEIPNKFIVGYGLDYNQLGRNLPEVYQAK